MELSPRRFAETVVLSPRGRIDHATSEAFRSAPWPRIATGGGGADRLGLDLSGVEHISSAGLRVLILAVSRAKGRGGALAVAAGFPAALAAFDGG